MSVCRVLQRVPFFLPWFTRGTVQIHKQKWFVIFDSRGVIYPLSYLRERRIRSSLEIISKTLVRTRRK